MEETVEETEKRRKAEVGEKIKEKLEAGEFKIFGQREKEKLSQEQLCSKLYEYFLDEERAGWGYDKLSGEFVKEEDKQKVKNMSDDEFRHMAHMADFLERDCPQFREKVKEKMD